ncbi:hypothetical protein AGMMS49965_20430 [Bacteroidia bacterium]|nr:hypothetical protein AGMMS49965_20430 [Bacteroidia bacterium]
MAWSGSGTQFDPWEISDGSSAGNSVTAYRDGATLYINGSGNMADFWNSTEGEAPWYSERTVIETVTIQEGVTNIGNRAFHDCSNLRANDLQPFTIPSSVKIIGRQAFYDCTSRDFTEIKIPATVNTIEAEAFWNCINLKNLTIDDGYNDLSFICYRDASYAYHYDWFKNCSIETLHLGRNYTYETTLPFASIQTLLTLNVKNTVSTIIRNSFANCTNLKTVTFEDGTNTLTLNTDYSRNASPFINSPIETLNISRPLIISDTRVQPFAGKTTIKTVTINRVSSSDGILNAGLFQNCTGLTSVTLPTSANITAIGESAFAGCTALPAIDIPKTVTSIGNSAFSDCQSLPSITILSSVTTIGTSAFANCNLLKTVTFEDGTNTLTLYTYDYSRDVSPFINSPIETLDISRPLVLSDTRYQPFANKTTIKAVTIGSQVTSIGQNLFNGCTGLTSVTNKATTPQSINANVFGGVNISLVSLDIPASAKDAYAVANVWKDFGIFADYVAFTKEEFIAEIAALQTEKADLESQNAALQTEKDDLESQNTALQTEKVDLESQNAALQVEIADLQAQLIECGESNGTSTRSVSESLLSISPNPTKGEIIIKSEQPIEKAEIFDISGRTVETWRAASLQWGNSQSINISHLPKGVYLVKIVVDGRSVVKKIIKE